MRIAVVGRGNVGGGLADLWERAGHEVSRFGRDGGDVADVEAVLLAVPGDAVADALEKLRGIEGKTVIDATNRYGVQPPGGFASNAEFVKSKTNGPTAKAFNINFASLYGRLGEARATPSNLWCGDDDARELVERLNRDAGYEPVRVGGLDKAAAQEGMVDLVFGDRGVRARRVRLPVRPPRGALKRTRAFQGLPVTARDVDPAIVAELSILWPRLSSCGWSST